MKILRDGYNTPHDVVLGKEDNLEKYKGWMNSPNHKAAILNSSYTSTGIGVVKHDNIYAWVELFGNKEVVTVASEYKTKQEQKTTTVKILSKNAVLNCSGLQNEIIKNLGFDSNNKGPSAEIRIHYINSQGKSYDDSIVLGKEDVGFSTSNSNGLGIDENGQLQYKKAGEYQVKATLKNYPSKTITETVVIKNPIYNLEIEDIPDQKYTGSEVKPKVVLKDNNYTLIEDVDYYLYYENNVECGNNAIIYILGDGYYNIESGDNVSTAEKTFTIIKGSTPIVDPVTKPEKVKNVKIDQIDYTNVTLSWGKVSDATGYKVYKYDEETKKYKYYGATTNLTLNISKLTPNTEYNFKVSAYKELGGKKYEGIASDTLTVTTNNPTPVDVRNLKVDARSVTTNSLKLTWEKLSNISGYQIYIFNYKTGIYNKLTTITNPAATSYVVKNLNPSTKYNFIVIAYRNVEGINYLGKQYSATPAVQVTKVAPITATRDETTTNAIRLTWSASPNATGYIIYRYNYSKKKYEKIVTTRDVTYVFTKLPSATKYNFKVKAYKVDNNKTYYGAASKTIITTTKPGKATNARATGKTKTRIRIRWNRVRGATGYRVYIYDSKTKKYKYYGSTKNTTALIKNRKANTTYKIKVQAYKKPYKLVYLGAASNTIRVKTLK